MGWTLKGFRAGRIENFKKVINNPVEIYPFRSNDDEWSLVYKRANKSLKENLQFSFGRNIFDCILDKYIELRNFFEILVDFTSHVIAYSLLQFTKMEDFLDFFALRGHFSKLNYVLHFILSILRVKMIKKLAQKSGAVK